MNIEELLLDFDRYAKESQNQLSEMLTAISEGKVPTQNDVSRLDDSIANLREKYNSVYQIALDQLSPDEMPELNSSIRAYSEAINNSDTIRLKRLIEDVKDCLQKFLAVRSLVSAYTDALLPIQSQARIFLKELSDNRIINTETINETSAGPRAFLAAIECKDKDSEEGMALCDQVAIYYPGRIYSGVVADKYYIDKSARLENDESKDADRATERLSDDECDTTESNFAKLDSSKSEAEKSVVDSQNMDSKSTDVDNTSFEKKGTFIDTLHAKRCFVDVEGSIGTFSLIKPQTESKKISSTIFINEMKEGLVKVEKLIVKALTTMNLVTVDYLSSAHDVKKDEAEQALAYLMRKGYLYKYSLSIGNEFYCASNRLIKSLEYKDACRFIGVRQHSKESWGHSIEDQVSSVASRVALVMLYSDALSRINTDSTRHNSESDIRIINMDSSFCVCFGITTDKSWCDVITGAFWDNDEECNQYLTSLISTLSNYELVSSFVFASLNVDIAKAIVDILIDLLGNQCQHCDIYLYSLKDKAYYSYPDCIQTKGIMPVNKIPEDGLAGCDDADVMGDDSINKIDSIADADIAESTLSQSNDLGILDQASESTRTNDITQVLHSNEEATSKFDQEIVEEENDKAVEIGDSDSIPQNLIESILKRSKKPTDDEFKDLIHSICNGQINSNGTLSDVMRATLLAKAASLSLEKGITSLLAKELLLATRLPFSTIHYSSETISDVLATCDNECLAAAIYLQSLLLPSSSYDYVLYQMSELAFRNFDVEFPSLTPLKALFNKMMSIHAVLPMGFSASVMGLLGDASERRKFTEELQIRAKNLMTLPNIKTRIKALPVMYGNCFGNRSELYDCMKIIAENKTDEVEWVKEVLAQYCNAHDDELTISEDKTEARLDAEWDEANPKNHFVLEFDARPQALRQFYNRLDLMKTWVDHVNQSYNGKLDIKRINVLKKEIIESANKAKEDLVEKTNDLDYLPVLLYALNHIICYLTDPCTVHEEMKEFLYTGVFSVDDKGMIILDDTMANIKYYEQWRNVLRHIVSTITNAELAKEEIIDEVGSALFDNLNQLEKILSSEHTSKGMLTETQIKDAKVSAEDRTKRFKENLELAYTYNRISEPEKERFATIMEKYVSSFFEIMDFGCWGQFLTALEREIDELASEKQNALRKELNARKQSLKEGETSGILEEAEMLLEEKLNFAVTEEYFNRFDNGERQFSEDLYALLHEEDSFADFLSDEKFKPLQQECERHSGKTLKSFAWSFLEPRVPREWSVRQREDSRRLVDNWPLRKDATQTSAIQNIFTCLGFSVKNVVKGTGKKEEYFKVDVEPAAKSMADYRHPISIFGTQTRSPLNVVVLYGNYAPKQLVDTITALDFGGMTIVLIDRPLDRATRRSIAEIFHTQTSGQNPFIVIDQILILYLAMHQVTERLPVLLKCTLPYSTYQPFVRDGGSTTDEMFCGRSRELATIIDPNGASVVYGGRQLGKTALLQRAESRCNKPENKEYAVYCNIINAGNEGTLVEKITEDINRKTSLAIPQSKGLSGFCKEVDKLFRNGKVKSLLLLLDEADTFLASIAETKYRELQPLIDLKRETTNKFKFVLAGLHNVCRAKNATSENGVFGQLGTPLCVKPLSPTDALQLLSRPLKYLGFEIDRYPHLETILTNTNYYPGILQFFGYNLVEAFATQYGRYYRAVNGNPPFTLQDEQLGAVMNDADLNRSIRDKFRWSLELDQRYFMLARCVTLLYYLRDENTENWLGFSVEDIMEIAAEYQIHCLENCGVVEYINLLDEMVEMGILSKPANGLYKLRRNSFVNIIGDDFDALDADIINNNKETA